MQVTRSSGGNMWSGMRVMRHIDHPIMHASTGIKRVWPPHVPRLIAHRQCFFAPLALLARHSVAASQPLWTFRHMTNFASARIRKRKDRRA